jgi:hypothetical protein
MRSPARVAVIASALFLTACGASVPHVAADTKCTADFRNDSLGVLSDADLAAAWARAQHMVASGQWVINAEIRIRMLGDRRLRGRVASAGMGDRVLRGDRVLPGCGDRNTTTPAFRTLAISLRSRVMNMDQSSFWSGEHLASLSPSPVSEADFQTIVATWPSNFLSLLAEHALGGLSGRTSPASYPLKATPLQIHVRRRHLWTWDATAKKWRLKTSTPQKSYTPSTASWPDFQNSGMASPTEFLTLSTSEFPSAAAVSSLSDILETGELPQRYFLSATACKGILRRAERRGKELPAAIPRASGRRWSVTISRSRWAA